MEARRAAVIIPRTGTASFGDIVRCRVKLGQPYLADAYLVRACITSLGSASRGHASLQRLQDEQSHMSGLPRALALRPSWTNLMVLRGNASISEVNGQVAVQLPHWKHLVTVCPSRAFISSIKPASISSLLMTVQTSPTSPLQSVEESSVLLSQL